MPCLTKILPFNQVGWIIRGGSGWCIVLSPSKSLTENDWGMGAKYCCSFGYKNMKTNETAFTGLKWSPQKSGSETWWLLITHRFTSGIQTKSYCTKPCGWQRLNLTWKWNEYALLTISWDTKIYLGVHIMFKVFMVALSTLAPTTRRQVRSLRDKLVTESKPKGLWEALHQVKQHLLSQKGTLEVLYFRSLVKTSIPGAGSQVGCHPWEWESGMTEAT